MTITSEKHAELVLSHNTFGYLYKFDWYGPEDGIVSVSDELKDWFTSHLHLLPWNMEMVGERTDLKLTLWRRVKEKE